MKIFIYDLIDLIERYKPTMDRYIAFDCETGGLVRDRSLLTVYFVVLDSDLTTILGELDLSIKPNAGDCYRVTAEAMDVNKINLVEHDKIAITEGEAAQKLYAFLQQMNPNGSSKLIPVGHNVTSDEDFIKEHLISPANWGRFVSYRRLDTGTISELLRATGHMPRDVKGSLGSIAAFLGIKFPDAHTAKGDTLATVKVLRKVIRILREEHNGTPR